MGHVTTTEQNGVTVRAVYAVRDAARLLVSHDEQGNPTPGYDQRLQPRDRSLAQYLKQRWNIARDLLFSKAAFFPGTKTPITTASDGPPFVHGDQVDVGNGRAADRCPCKRRC